MAGPGIDVKDPLTWTSYGNEYAADAFTVVRNTPAGCPEVALTDSQNSRPFGLSRPEVPSVEPEPSQFEVMRRSVVTPPNRMNLSRRTLALTSKPLYVDLFCVEYVSRLSVAMPTLVGFRL